MNPRLLFWIPACLRLSWERLNCYYHLPSWIPYQEVEHPLIALSECVPNEICVPQVY